MEKKPRKVVCAALRVGNEIICGPRHYCSIMISQIKISGLSAGEWKKAEQGFVDQYDCFLTREQAYVIAKHAGQITDNHDKSHSQIKDILISEDLY